MKLQFAMDTLTTEAALELAAAAAPHVDILELGTPLIKSAGLSAVTAIKKAHPDKIVFADLKTMDAGELEADIAFAAGADLVTVLGSPATAPSSGAVKAAEEARQGRRRRPDRRRRQARPRQGGRRPRRRVRRDARRPRRAGRGGLHLRHPARDGEASGVPFSVAGGVNASTIASVQESGAQVAVAGGAIYGAPDVGAAAAELRAAIV